MMNHESFECFFNFQLVFAVQRNERKCILLNFRGEKNQRNRQNANNSRSQIAMEQCAGQGTAE